MPTTSVIKLSPAVSLALIMPACLAIVALFIYPLGYSIISAFEGETGFTLAHWAKAWDYYALDILFTLAVVLASTVLTGLWAIAIAGYLTLGTNARVVAVLAWLYRWPLFIPFVVAGQLMRAFLAKSGMLNTTILATGLIEPTSLSSWLDWRGIIVTFAWKQTPFVAMLLAGAMAGLDRATIEAARNLGAGRLRILVEIVVPQVRTTLFVGLILTFVTVMSVLSVPMMINAQSPNMITVDMAWRINTYSDYGVANVLGIMSYLMTSVAAWIYLRQGIAKGGTPK